MFGLSEFNSVVADLTTGTTGVVSLVCALSDGYKVGENIYRTLRDEWNNRKEKGKKGNSLTHSKDDEKDLDDSLVRSGPRIRQEYEGHFSSLGSQFAQGDGKKCSE